MRLWGGLSGKPPWNTPITFEYAIERSPEFDDDFFDALARRMNRDWRQAAPPVRSHLAIGTTIRFDAPTDAYRGCNMAVVSADGSEMGTVAVLWPKPRGRADQARVGSQQSNEGECL